MGVPDGHQHSVRVEVETNTAAPGATPAEPGGGPKWVPALALVAVVVIVGAILALRPSGDEAADGSERSVPTTTIPEADETPDDDPDADLNDGEDDEATSSEIVPTVVVSESDISQIVPAGVGFLGLVEGSGSTPQILRSLDGLDWVDVETTVVTADGRDLVEFDWFRLMEVDDGFVLSGFEFGEAPRPAAVLFVSGNGSNWVELTLSGPADPTFFFTNSTSRTFYGFSFHLGAIEAFLLEHTTLELPDVGVCDLPPQDADFETLAFDVVDCTGETIGVLDASTVQETFVAEDVLACALVITGVSNSEGLEFGRLDSEGNLTSFGLIAPQDIPTDLPDGRIAVLDFGSFDFGSFEACDGFAGIEERDPGIVVANDVSSDVRRFGFPTVRPVFPGENVTAPTGPTNIVGEVAVGDDRYLVLFVDDALWALDFDTGAWWDPLTSSETPFSDGFEQQVLLSESGSRAFAIANSLLLTLDFEQDEDGELTVVETTQPISLTDGPGAGINFTELLFATDELLFITNGDRVWTLEAPPVPNQ